LATIYCIKALKDETKGTSNVNEAVRWRHRFRRFPEMSKNETSKFQYFAILFIHLCYPQVFALW